MPMLKVNTTFCADFIKSNVDGEIVDRKFFTTPNAMIDSSTELKVWFDFHITERIVADMEDMSNKGSGWALSKIIHLEIAINKFEMGNCAGGVGGSSYIKLPNQISKKKACINVKNNDEACFFWSVVSALYPTKTNSDRTTNYPFYSSVLRTDGLELPMKLSQITKFEKMNDISVNVYGLQLTEKENQSFYSVSPLRLTQHHLAHNHVNLLIVQDKYFPNLSDYDVAAAAAQPLENISISEIKYHYCWIKDLSRLVSRQLSKHKTKKFICDRCLNYFSSQIKLNEHFEWCKDLNNEKVTFPKYDNVEFRNFVFKQKCPFIVYADFESLLRQCNKKISEKSFKYQEHVPYSVGYYLKCVYNDNFSRYASFRGETCLDWFADEIDKIASFVYSNIKHIEPMSAAPRDVGTHCHICEKSFNDKDVIVRDHDHFSSEFRGWAHQQCNLNFRKLFIVPIVFHNLSNYDGHFIVKSLLHRGNITTLPINKEKYISFTYFHQETKLRFRFIDSFKFMGASLDELASTLILENFYNLKKEFSSLHDSEFELLTRKGTFCYDYMTDLDKLNDTALPSINEFHNKLTNSHIDAETYHHAQTVWKTFKIKSLGEYSDLYMKTDILLLADVMENFRKTALETYKLDPAWYYTMPGYTWDCMLKYTKCKLQILKDIDMVMFVERGIRGGISCCMHRLSEANNPQMDNFDTSKPESYLLYLDVNNLYGWAMSQYLPFGDFEWCDTSVDVSIVPDDGPEGYILQVDLEYPQHLHDLHKDLPLCPEHSVPPGSKLPKLLCTLSDKKDYIIHYRNLKTVLELGLRLIKIKKVLKFKQSPWLKPYIDLNTELRAKATTKFGKNQFKFANNAIFGKTMENIRLHRVVRLVNRYEGRFGAKNLIASPRFHSRTVFGEDLMAIELKKNELLFNKPLYIGMAILDISKVCMYNFHYKYMLPKNPDGCKIMYIDTDSFFYEIRGCNPYELIKMDCYTHFDTSDYPKTNAFNIPLVNKKVPGLMKDEVNGEIITHFAGLRSKMYAFKVQGGKITKKSKGVKNYVVKNHLTFDDYVKCLKENEKLVLPQNTIGSFAHDIYSIQQSKIVLSAQDDKRYLIPSSFDTLPWGHYSLQPHTSSLLF
ncbi:uncharacterized protein LOC123675190 [Harmonia axyridis]|uniref:uncharacterized protein LOC123675190 n=2 Tax=Harmonia axyridis TaxID=115357 RepID=UPI001E2792A9|nr:uncharacterized protein LOC123675190 [Harmonia axyridis]